MSDPIVLYDTTLRDGTQREGLVLSLADKLKIARRLDEAGFAYIEGGWPGSNPKDEEFFAAARGMTFRHARLAAFGSTRHRANRAEEDPNIRALVAAETPVTTIFGKSWLLHVTEVLGATAEENLAMIGDSVAHLRAAGREVVYDAEHFFDGCKADPAYALATLRSAVDAGATTVVLCDTNGGCLTDEVAAMTRSVVSEIGPRAIVGIHVHDDAGLAVANSLAAVQAGANHVQGTINGYGERCGNANLVTIWANLALKLGRPTVPAGDDLTRLPELAHFVAEVANIAPDAHAPYVGTSAFAHKGGVHGAATVRVERAYQHVDPSVVGGTSRLVVSELGGRANAAWRLRQLEPIATEGIDAAEMSRLVKQLEADGASFEGADASFALLVRRLQKDYAPPFRIVDFTVIVERRNGAPSRAEASVKVEVDGEILHTAADGNGPVHALDLALRKALGRLLPRPRWRAPGRLQGPHHRRRCGDRRADAGDHRDRPSVRDLDHGRRRREHHRGLARGAPRLVRVCDLAARRTPRAPGRARLVAGRARSAFTAGGSIMTAVEPSATQAAALDGRRPSIGAWAYFEGAMVPIEQANVSLATHALNYGTSVFEGIRAYRQHSGGVSVLFGHEHYERLLRNARLLRASVPESADELLEITIELLRRNEHDGDAYVRPIIYKAAHSIRVQLSDLEDRIGIFTIPLGDYLPTGGIRVTVSGWQRVSDNAIPARGKIAGSYVNAALATEDAHAGGYDDALLLTADGHVAEASAANIFAVFGREVATPPLVDDVLPGSRAAPSSSSRATPATTSSSAESTDLSSISPTRCF